MDTKLEEIAATLTAIRAQGTDWKRAMYMGLFQGAGVIIGSIIALALLGWVLTLLGVVPGFDGFETYLNSIVTEYQRTR
ncbi:MAG TPA: hypothetical protein PK109_03350 [Candidatus Paceibacterota bacterium]|nr:hypothetical protein [Candidatus Paceibacterota bacterium]